MANVMKLEDPNVILDFVEFSPREGNRQPNNIQRVNAFAKDGTLWQYTFFNKARYEIPVNNINNYDYTHLKTWWEGEYILNFYPDIINDALTFITVKFANEEQIFIPMNSEYYNANTLYTGTLILIQYTAI